MAPEEITPTRPMSVLLGALLLAGAARETCALHVAGDALDDVTLGFTQQLTCADTDAGAADTLGDHCALYKDNPRWCDFSPNVFIWDDDDFSSHDMCCACGGGRKAPTTAPTTGLVFEHLAEEVYDGTAWQYYDRPVQDDFTISFEFKTTSINTHSTGRHWYAGMGMVDAETANAVNDFGISMMSGLVTFGIGNPDTTIKTASTFADGEWHHVVASRARSTGAFSLYVDGILAGTEIGNTESLTSPSQICVGGINTGGGSRAFYGSIRALRIYSVALVPDDIMATAATPTPVSTPNDRKASSKPQSAIQLGAAWWPWGKKRESARHEVTNDEKAPAANATQQILASVGSDDLVGHPSQPGCYMRMPSGCPKKPMNTHVWRHDAWAEQRGLDRAGCEDRRRVWDKYCESDDAQVYFIPTPPNQ